MEVVISWWWARAEDFDLCRCLYAYLHPRTDKLLYLGKADRQSVGQRMKGRHKNDVYEYLEREHRCRSSVRSLENCFSMRRSVIQVPFWPTLRVYSSTR